MVLQMGNIFLLTSKELADDIQSVAHLLVNLLYRVYIIKRGAEEKERLLIELLFVIG